MLLRGELAGGLAQVRQEARAVADHIQNAEAAAQAGEPAVRRSELAAALRRIEELERRVRRLDVAVGVVSRQAEQVVDGPAVSGEGTPLTEEREGQT